MAQDISKNHLLFLFDYYDLIKELLCWSRGLFKFQSHCSLKGTGRFNRFDFIAFWFSDWLSAGCNEISCCIELSHWNCFHLLTFDFSNSKIYFNLLAFKFSLGYQYLCHYFEFSWIIMVGSVSSSSKSLSF